MSWVQRIDSTRCNTHGWQARAPIHGQPKRYVSRFFADKVHGGKRKAKSLAEEALPKLRRLARRQAQ